ncbi:hypothetical protein ALC60_05570, partial [Trachymyrmex zeteki]
KVISNIKNDILEKVFTSFPPTAVTGVGLAPNSYKIDGESQIGVGRGFPADPENERSGRTRRSRRREATRRGLETRVTRDPGQSFQLKGTSKRRESLVTQAVSAVKPGGSTVASGALVSQLAFDCGCVYRGGGSARTHRRTRIHNIADLLSNLLLVPAKAHPPISGVEGELVFEKGISAGYEESKNLNADEEGEDGNTIRLKLEARKRTFRHEDSN